MKKIVIIGGGIAGLSAGIFAQLNGFDSVILEKNKTLGGECTGWDRQGYHIDGCIHWLTGTKEGTQLNSLWKKVGALDGVEIYHPDTFMTFDYHGVTISLYRDIERLEASWIAISPQDEKAIKEFCENIKKLQSFEIPAEKPMDLLSIFEKIKLLESMKEAGSIMRKYGKVTLGQYAAEFHHEGIQKLLTTFVPEGYSASSIFFALAAFMSDNASIPSGGSKAMAMRMEKRYKSLGGKIETSCEVVSIELSSSEMTNSSGNKEKSLKRGRKRVNKVICRNGNSFTADYFIAAFDAQLLYHKLLKDQFQDKKYTQRFENNEDYPLASNIYLSFGYEGSMENKPRTLRFPITPFLINKQLIEYLTVNHYQYEPSFAPEGHVLLTCAINQYSSDYDAWSSLAKDKKAYKQEKDRIGALVIKALEEKNPAMAGRIKLLDVATPITYEKYCNAYHGAFMGFLPTIRGKAMEHTGRIKGLENLHLSGQWLQPPGGLPVAVMTGKDTVMRICKKEKRQFVTFD